METGFLKVRGGILPENRHFHAKQLQKYQTQLITQSSVLQISGTSGQVLFICIN